MLQVKKRINLVYGGGSVGLMGLISQTVFDGGCHVLGYLLFVCFVFFSSLDLFMVEEHSNLACAG